MPEQDRWQLELSEYIRQGEPERAEKSAAWQTAIGLQAVDGLKTSTYLLETAKTHIEGEYRPEQDGHEYQNDYSIPLAFFKLLHKRSSPRVYYLHVKICFDIFL